MPIFVEACAHVASFEGLRGKVVIAGSASRGTRFEIAVFLIARDALWVGAGERRISL